MDNLKLSQTYNLLELCVTDTGLKNEPSPSHILNLLFLHNNLLMPLTIFLGKKPHINSCFRSFDVNIKVGGLKSSFHTKGLAVDIRNDFSNQQIIWMQENLPFDNMILYIKDDKTSRGFIHIEYTPWRTTHQIFSTKKY